MDATTRTAPARSAPRASAPADLVAVPAQRAAAPVTVIHRSRGFLSETERAVVLRVLAEAGPGCVDRVDPDVGHAVDPLAQHVLHAVTPTGTAGVLTFRPAVVHPRFRDRGPCVYATRVVVRPEHQRTGIARLLHERLVDLMLAPTSPLATQLPPWVLVPAAAENRAHRALLAAVGFTEVDRTDDGDPTVYLARAVR